MQDKLHLIEDLRELVLSRIGGQGGQYKEEVIAQLFDEIDIDRSGEISSDELRDLLRALHLHYTESKYRRVWKEIARDGKITLEALKKVLIPQEDKQHRAEGVNTFDSVKVSLSIVLKGHSSVSFLV
jgi:hypothetical protein